MTDYWVSYLILNSRDGSQLGVGTIHTTMPGPPRTPLEVDRLSDSIDVPSGQYAAVLSWSRMGD